MKYIKPTIVKKELLRLADQGPNENTRRIWKDVADKSNMKLLTRVSREALNDIDRSVNLMIRDLASKKAAELFIEELEDAVQGKMEEIVSKQRRGRTKTIK
tara:strand:- start:19045 stop:19347 length:303 start_codon:yes stop_codon:yes gene_type:complete